MDATVTHMIPKEDYRLNIRLDQLSVHDTRVFPLMHALNVLEQHDMIYIGDVLKIRPTRLQQLLSPEQVGALQSLLHEEYAIPPGARAPSWRPPEDRGTALY